MIPPPFLYKFLARAVYPPALFAAVAQGRVAHSWRASFLHIFASSACPTAAHIFFHGDGVTFPSRTYTFGPLEPHSNCRRVLGTSRASSRRRQVNRTREYRAAGTRCTPPSSLSSSRADRALYAARIIARTAVPAGYYYALWSTRSPWKKWSRSFTTTRNCSFISSSSSNSSDRRRKRTTAEAPRTARMPRSSVTPRTGERVAPGDVTTVCSHKTRQVRNEKPPFLLVH